MLLLYVLNFEWDSDHTWSVAWSHSSCKDRKGLQMLPVYFETVLMVASSNKPLRHFSKLGYNPRHKEYWKNQGHNLRTINLSICRPSTMWRACSLLCGIWQHVCQMCWLNRLAAVKKKKICSPLRCRKLILKLYLHTNARTTKWWNDPSWKDWASHNHVLKGFCVNLCWTRSALNSSVSRVIPFVSKPLAWLSAPSLALRLLLRVKNSTLFWSWSTATKNPPKSFSGPFKTLFSTCIFFQSTNVVTKSIRRRVSQLSRCLSFTSSSISSRGKKKPPMFHVLLCKVFSSLWRRESWTEENSKRSSPGGIHQIESTLILQPSRYCQYSRVLFCMHVFAPAQSHCTKNKQPIIHALRRGCTEHAQSYAQTNNPSFIALRRGFSFSVDLHNDMHKQTNNQHCHEKHSPSVWIFTITCTNRQTTHIALKRGFSFTSSQWQLDPSPFEDYVKAMWKLHWETNPSSFLSLLCIAPPKKSRAKIEEWKNVGEWWEGTEEISFLFFSYLSGSHCSLKSGQTVIERPQNGDHGVRDALALS